MEQSATNIYQDYSKGFPSVLKQALFLGIKWSQQLQFWGSQIPVIVTSVPTADPDHAASTPWGLGRGQNLADGEFCFQLS